MNGLLSIAAGAVESFATVYNGLETSATILGQSLKNNTVKVVDHKYVNLIIIFLNSSVILFFIYRYGRPAGEATEDAFTTVGNVITINRNLKVITPKGLAKQTAKDTGKAVISDHRNGITNGRMSNGRTPIAGNSFSNTTVVSSIRTPLPSTSKSEDAPPLPEKK